MSQALSHKLDAFCHFCKGRKEMTFGELLSHLSTGGPAVCCLLFSIPFLFFAWVPIVMRALGLLILLAGVRIALHKPLWIPKKFSHHRVSGDKVAHKLVFWIKLVQKIEKTIHPRGTAYQHNPFLQTFNGFIVSLAGLFLLLPFSPVAGFLPALTVFLLSLGILEEDLWMMIISYLVVMIKMVILFLPLILPLFYPHP